MSDAHDRPPPLDKAVKTRRERQARGRKDREPSVAQYLATIGVLGWTIVTPILLGIFLGRWLDRAFDTGAFWMLSLLAAGLAVGCFLGWKWITRQ